MSNLQNPAAFNSISPLGFWDDAIGILSRELSPQQFKTWIQPLTLLSIEESEDSLTIGAPNRFKLDWIKKTFADRFQ
jgi:chromosomal replication initiator protein